MSVVRVGLLFLVTVWFGSSARGGAAPGSLRVDRDSDDVVLSWDAGTGPYAVFKGTEPGLLARPANHVASTPTLTYTDQGAAVDALSYFYFVGDELECLGDSDCDDADPCNAFERCDLDFGTLEITRLLTAAQAGDTEASERTSSRSSKHCSDSKRWIPGRPTSRSCGYSGG